MNEETKHPKFIFSFKGDMIVYSNSNSKNDPNNDSNSTSPIVYDMSDPDMYQPSGRIDVTYIAYLNMSL